ncbi:hypothetical protein [Rhodocyclus tenuis]|uniref:Helix-turn-helix domain-containing protein n=1 Tax=Rhodocyclus tenuis TaxID=1066 RepID=A0A840G7U3_RHOTE|nr:hypothetical protein [Rhodocyclus tenuis]MBB4247955.1 hypothetical protein [Rhodocyclus tenuis]
MSGEAGGTIRVHRRQSWSSVPDAVLEAVGMSFGARLVLAWLLGRPTDWEIRIGHMCRVLGLTEKTWPRIRDELRAAGFFESERTRRKEGEGMGRFEWRNAVTDAPLYAIPPKRGNGSTIPPKSMDGKRMDAGGGDYQKVVDQPVLTTTTNPLGGGGSRWDEQIAAAVWAEGRAGRQIKNRGGFAATLRKRLDAAGPTDDDLVQLADYRAALAADARREEQRAIASRPLETDPETLAAGNRVLDSVRARRAARAA